MEYTGLLVLHLLGACIWTGGQLILSTRMLPAAIKAGDPSPVLDFDARFRLLGHIALGAQLLTGFRLAQINLPMWAWFGFEGYASTHITAKLVLLLMTVVMAIVARRRVMRTLTPETLGAAAVHIVAMSVVAVLLVLVGLGFRVGGIF